MEIYTEVVEKWQLFDYLLIPLYACLFCIFSLDMELFQLLSLQNKG